MREGQKKRFETPPHRRKTGGQMPGGGRGGAGRVGGVCFFGFIVEWGGGRKIHDTFFIPSGA